MDEVKTAVNAEILNLTLITRRQLKHIDLLDKILKQVLKEKEAVQESLLSEQQCLGAVQAVEKQRSSMAAKVNSERDIINAKLESCEKIRSDLKSEVAQTCVSRREEMEKLIKDLNQMAVIEKKQAKINESLKTRYETCKSELTASIEKQQKKNDAQRAFFDKMKTKFELEIKKRNAEVMELSEKLKRMNEKLCKIQSEKTLAIDVFEYCKRNGEQELFDLKQKKAGLEKELKERHDAQVAWNQETRRLEEKQTLLEGAKRALEEQEQALIKANERYKEEEVKLKLMSTQHESEGDTLREEIIDLDCKETYHNEHP
uniref:Uncharacterized protein n=1 Tax=Anopheles atroparvus TaxID=41427 RepID=A0A182JKM6_ANOAO